MTRPDSSDAPLTWLTGRRRAAGSSYGPLLDTCEQRDLRQAAQSSSPVRGTARCRQCFGVVARTEHGCRACREHVYLHVRSLKVRRQHATEQQRNAARLSMGRHGPSLCFPLRACCRLLDARGDTKLLVILVSWLCRRRDAPVGHARVTVVTENGCATANAHLERCVIHRSWRGSVGCGMRGARCSVWCLVRCSVRGVRPAVCPAHCVLRAACWLLSAQRFATKQSPQSSSKHKCSPLMFVVGVRYFWITRTLRMFLFVFFLSLAVLSFILCWCAAT